MDSSTYRYEVRIITRNGWYGQYISFGKALHEQDFIRIHNNKKPLEMRVTKVVINEVAQGVDYIEVSCWQIQEDNTKLDKHWHKCEC